MIWENDWPIIGVDKDGDGCGEPVLTYRKPNVGKTYPVCTPQESDEFNTTQLGYQWQWHANFNSKWIFNDSANSSIRLYSYPVVENYKSLWDVANLLLQKTPSTQFTATMKLTFEPHSDYYGERTGLVVMGRDYGALILENTKNGIILSQVECKNADKGATETENTTTTLQKASVYLRVSFNKQAQCRFSYSTNNKKFIEFGSVFQAREGKWIGAKVGTFCTRPHMVINDGGWADVDWFRITK
jgi:beta-xylosidase